MYTRAQLTKLHVDVYVSGYVRRHGLQTPEAILAHLSTRHQGYADRDHSFHLHR